MLARIIEFRCACFHAAKVALSVFCLTASDAHAGYLVCGPNELHGWPVITKDISKECASKLRVDIDNRSACLVWRTKAFKLPRAQEPAHTFTPPEQRALGALRPMGEYQMCGYLQQHNKILEFVVTSALPSELQ